MRRAEKILILAVKAGAGHLRAAAALEEALRAQHPDVNVKNVEALEFTSPAFRESFTRAYERLARDLPSVWKIIYEQMERKPVDSKTKRLATLFDRLNSRAIVKLADDYDPDAVICTHYFPAEVLAARRRKGKLRARLHLTLTDYDIHTMWIQPGVDHYFVATDEMAHAMREKGIGSAKVSVTGIPIMPIFARTFPPADEMRRKLNLRPKAPTVLMSAGGFGLMRVDEVVGVVADTVPDVQILALAGKNERLAAALRHAAASRPGKIVPLGFVTNMHELMAASDFVVGKPGGLTSSECLAMGLPMVIMSPIPGQEERNADYLLESGVALRANSPAHLVYKVRRLLTDKALLERMKTAALRIATPRAAYDIASEVLKGA